MDDAARATPEPGPGESVLVLSCWADGPAGGPLIRATFTEAGQGTHVRRLASREQLHALVDEWLDGAQTPPDAGSAPN